MTRRPPRPPLFPSPPLSRSAVARRFVADVEATGYFLPPRSVASYDEGRRLLQQAEALAFVVIPETLARDVERGQPRVQLLDRKSTRLNSSHSQISYAVFCLK